MALGRAKDLRYDLYLDPAGSALLRSVSEELRAGSRRSQQPPLAGEGKGPVPPGSESSSVHASLDHLPLTELQEPRPSLAVLRDTQPN